jgi:hypothetical protein
MTAHWIGKVEGMTALQFKMALITFHHLYDRHDGKTLAETILRLLDRAQITVKVRLLHEAAITMHIPDTSLKVGHFTLDNAISNGTMMQSLQIMLEACDIAFDVVDRKIMCFTHIVDLSSKQVMCSVNKTKWVMLNACEAVNDDGGDSSQSNDETAVSNPIACGRNVAQVI